MARYSALTMAIAQITPIFADTLDGRLAVTIGPDTRTIDRQEVVAILQGRSLSNEVLAAQIALACQAAYPNAGDFAAATASEIAALVRGVWWPQ